MIRNELNWIRPSKSYVVDFAIAPSVAGSAADVEPSPAEVTRRGRGSDRLCHFLARGREWFRSAKRQSSAETNYGVGQGQCPHGPVLGRWPTSGQQRSSSTD